MSDNAMEIAQARMKRELQAATHGAAMQIYTSMKGSDGTPIYSLEQCIRLACISVGYVYSDHAIQIIEQVKSDPKAFWESLRDFEAQTRKVQRLSRLQNLEDEARLFEPWISNNKKDETLRPSRPAG